MSAVKRVNAGSADVPSAVPEARNIPERRGTVWPGSFALRAQCGRDVRAPSKRVSLGFQIGPAPSALPGYWVLKHASSAGFAMKVDAGKRFSVPGTLMVRFKAKSNSSGL